MSCVPNVSFWSWKTRWIWIMKAQSWLEKRACVLLLCWWLLFGETSTLDVNSIVEPQIHLSLKIHFKKNNLWQLLMLKTFVVNRINIRTNTEQPIYNLYRHTQYTVATNWDVTRTCTNGFCLLWSLTLFSQGLALWKWGDRLNDCLDISLLFPVMDWWNKKRSTVRTIIDWIRT